MCLTLKYHQTKHLERPGIEPPACWAGCEHATTAPQWTKHQVCISRLIISLREKWKYLRNQFFMLFSVKLKWIKTVANAKIISSNFLKKYWLERNMKTRRTPTGGPVSLPFTRVCFWDWRPCPGRARQLGEAVKERRCLLVYFRVYAKAPKNAQRLVWELWSLNWNVKYFPKRSTDDNCSWCSITCARLEF